MSEHDDKDTQDGDTPPVIDFDTPDQPNSWVAEIARRRNAHQLPAQPSAKERHANGR